MMIALLACLFVEGFFASSEMALVSLHRSSLDRLVGTGSHRARMIKQLLAKPESFLGTTLLGTNLATITLNAIATLFVIRTLGANYDYVTALFTTPLILIFAEALPKSLAQRYPERVSLAVIYPLKWVARILSPIVWVMSGTAKLITRASGVHSDKKTPFLTREEIECVFKASEQRREIKDLEQKMIGRIFSFTGKKGRDIMIPLIDMVSVSETLSMDEVETLFQTQQYSRLPVYKGRVDHVVGWITHYDLLKNENRSLHVKDLMRPVRFMLIHVELGKLLLKMQRMGETLVMMVDEYGGTVGMVTLEDVLEEIVGDIEDEYDFGSQFVKEVFKDRIVVDAKIPLVKLEEIFGLQLPKRDADTLNGFLLEKCQDIPRSGERLNVGRFQFHVTRASDRRVEEVEIRL